MLDKKFKHKYWFKDSDMTVKEFLNYVLSTNGDFIIQVKMPLKTNNLFETSEKIYYLSDRRYSYKLNLDECNYLAQNNTYFKDKLSA